MLNLLHPNATRWSLALAMAASLLTTPVAHAALTANADGTVTDSTTNLVWDQCAYGLTGSTCASGSAFYGEWPSALAQASAANTAVYKGFSDWRVPNKNELESIVKRDVYSPAIDATAFPNTPTYGYFWTSTTYAPDPAGAWIVDFGYGGNTYADLKVVDYFVRLVRSGQSFAPFDGLSPLVNGSCGSAHATTPLITSAPSANLCGLGSTAGSVTTGASAYTWACAGSNGGTAASCSASRGYTVTPSAGANGSISPNTAQVVAYNATPAFTVTANGGYGASASGCGGSLVGTAYTTAAVTADCAVQASFSGNDSTPDAFSFTAANGVALSTVQTSNTITVAGITTAASISITGGEYQIGSGSFVSTAGTVSNGDTVTVRHTSSGAYSTATTTRLTVGGVSADFVSTTEAAPVINGACGTSHNTSLVTSAPVTNLCSVGTATSVTSGTNAFTWSCTGSGGGSTASCSASRGYTVTPGAGANGSISPNVVQVVAYNATPAFTVTANSGYAASASGCGGSLVGNIYTTAAITAACGVQASFTLNTSYTAPSPGGGGNIITQLGGGGASCALQTASYQPASAVGATPPAGVTFPQGVVNFTTTNSCTPNGAITVTLTYPSALPVGTQFYKYGPATPSAAPTWYAHPASIVGNTITYSVTDNGQGDSNATAGQITDPGGPGVPGGGAGADIAGVPTLSEWAMLALAGLIALATFLTMRRRIS